MNLKDLLNNREAIKNRNAEIIAALSGLAKSDPKRADLVGEQTANNLKLKTLNTQIAQANREANGTSEPTVEDMINKVHTKLGLGGGADLAENKAVMKRIAAITAMHALVLKFADNASSPGKVEDRANDIAEAAWQIADAMFDATPPIPDTDDEGDEG